MNQNNSQWYWWLSVAEKNLQPLPLVKALGKGLADYVVAVKNVPANIRETKRHIEQEKQKMYKLEALIFNAPQNSTPNNPFFQEAATGTKSLNLTR